MYVECGGEGGGACRKEDIEKKGDLDESSDSYGPLLHLVRHVLHDKLHGAVHAVVDPPPVVTGVVIRLWIERHELGR